MTAVMSNPNNDSLTFEPIEPQIIDPSTEHEDSLAPVARDISAIALAMLLIEVKLDSIEDDYTRRSEKRELQERVKECNASVVSNLGKEGWTNTIGPIAIFIISLGVGSMDPNFVSAASQIGMPLVTGWDQLNYAVTKEKDDREKQTTEALLQGRVAAAEQASQGFKQTLDQSKSAILNS